MPRRFRISTFQTISLSFLIMIALGTLLLMLPTASREAGSAPFSDCLFTATSASCVTGLVVRDTGTSWTPFGQAVILVLIQVGGMGVVTAAIATSFVSGRKIGLMQRTTMQEAISAPQVGGIIRLTRFILLTTGVMELAGAALLSPVFIPRFGVLKGMGYAVFHSISAFCNAGFDLMGVQEPFSSLTSLTWQPLANTVLILLITIGGIGFLTWDDVRQHRFRLRRYRMQSKIILVTSAALILVPFLYFLISEFDGMSLTEKIWPSLFQSVTLRTAGFNTVDLNGISGSGQAMMIFWMLVGGSPGSTAGGMKTTTIAVLILAARSVLMRREHVECYGRRIEDSAVRHAVAILLLYMTLFIAAAMAISRIEEIPLLTCLFETASAIGTVGLSLGITSSLGAVSRVILILLMFFGRVGGLTLIYAVQSSGRNAQGALPLEKITVG